MTTNPIEPRRDRPRPVLLNPSRGRSSHSLGARLAMIALVLFLVIVVAGGGLFYEIHSTPSGSSRTVTFHVGSGDTVSTIADRLQSAGLISNTLLFHVDAKIRDLGAGLKVGDYPLSRNMSIDQIVTALTRYHARTISVTIPEGYRIEQMAAVLRNDGISTTQFLHMAEHPTGMKIPILKSKPASASLEGYLFPNTYDVPPHYNGADFARYMVETLNKKFTPAMWAEARAEGLSVYQVLTLASIVEREAKVASERPIIASVYLNRLRIGMPLQADPTVQYVVGTKQDWWPVLTAAQVHTPGAYNTYDNKGLPPGPIANPGLASITAVLRPAHTHYLYFVAKGHGRHAFAVTYAQQLANEARYAGATP